MDDSYASELETRRSIMRWLIYLYGCLVSWKSRPQKNVTLSSTEAEYVGISEVSAEIIFICDILKFLGVMLKFPIMVH